jgi:hypothetical protein
MRTTVIAAAVVTLLSAPAGAAESCAPGEGDARAVQESPTGDRLYETDSGMGMTGERGYAEASLSEDEARLHARSRSADDGSAADVDVRGRPDGPHACANGHRV